MRISTLLFSLLVSSHALAAPFSLEPSDSRIGFRAEQAGEAFEGEFPSHRATIQFDPKNLDESSISIEVDVAKVRVDGDDRQEEIIGPEWLDITRYATARFESHDIEKTESGYMATGTLTIRGVSHDVAVPFTLTPRGRDYYAKGDFTIHRRDYFVGTGQWEQDTWVAFPVKIVFDLLCIRQSSTTGSYESSQPKPHS